jgi:hypothetical protein
MRIRTIVVAAACAFGLAAPAAAQGDASAPALQRTSDRQRHARDLITAEDIAAHPARDAYDLVQRLHADWLRGHASATNLAGRVDPVMVVLDGAQIGPVTELRRLKAEAVGEMRFVGSEEAVSRWGMGHSAGVILVTSR